MDSPSPGLETLLARLAASGTDFLLVGGLAAVAQGAPLSTVDVDVVHRRDPGNVTLLLALSPEERLRLNDRMALNIQELRDGFAAAEPDHAARPAGGERD